MKTVLIAAGIGLLASTANAGSIKSQIAERMGHPYSGAIALCAMISPSTIPSCVQDQFENMAWVANRVRSAEDKDIVREDIWGCMTQQPEGPIDWADVKTCLLELKA